jgi:uncharacterized protein
MKRPIATTAYLFLIAFATALLLSACGDGNGSSGTFRPIEFRHDGTLDVLNPDGTVRATLNIEVAEGDSAQARGLMERTSLPPRSGMLFVGDVEEPKSFWMENTPMPLDIIFISADSQVVSISERTRPFSRESIESSAPAQYVLEVRAGMAQRLGLTDSTRFRWTY